MLPPLNWRELALLLERIGPETEGLFVDRIVVPLREGFPEGYVKGEWAIRFTGRKSESTLLVSIRPRHAYLACCHGKGPAAASQATRSPFDLNLSKHLRGAKLAEIVPIPRERVVVLWFSAESQPESRLGLVLVLIPTAPEALLVLAPKDRAAGTGWPILARSRTIRDPAKLSTHYLPPDGAGAPADPKIRNEVLSSADSFYQGIEKSLQGEAFQVRIQIASKALEHLLKQAQDRLRQSEVSFREAGQEEDWQKLGDLLKSSLGNPPELRGSFRAITDFTTEEEIQIPCDPKLSLKEQIEKFYHNARRKKRRLQEAQSRADRFREIIGKLEHTLSNPPQLPDWPALEHFEALAGISYKRVSTSTPGKSPKKSSHSLWRGKSFLSKEGFTILVGRNKDENLELTFKLARGNDLWMHIRGRPGAHLLIPLPSGKSASLDTILDAAQLAIYYSGGEKWGKTEVDYTFKKYVKRIPDSSEASYTHNKTLLIEPDTARLKRLLDQGSLASD